MQEFALLNAARTVQRAISTTPLSRNDSIEEGSATVSVAAIGVPPMASGTRGTEPNGE